MIKKIMPSIILAADVPVADDITQYDPLTLGGSSYFGAGDTTIGAVISRVLLFLYPLVTILLFALLLWGGIEYMVAGINSKSAKAEVAKKRIIAALLGFALVAVSFIIMKVLGTAFGINLPF